MRAAYTSGMTQIAVAARREAARERTGQFGEQVHSAPEATLFTVDEIDVAAERRAAAAKDRRFDEKWLKSVKAAAGWQSLRKGQYHNREEIMGDTVVQILDQTARGTGSRDEALAMYVSRSVATVYATPGEHHTSRKARYDLNDWADRFAQEHGRWPTQAERASKADEIRLSRTAGQRPSVGFEDPVSITSMDDSSNEDVQSYSLSLTPREQSGYATDTSRAAAAYDALEDDNSSFKPADARKCVWNLLSENGPQVAVKTIYDDRAHRAAVDAAGGPLAVARTWASGEAAEDDPAIVALFAPFGTRLTEKDREAAVDVLTRNAGYADKVWDSAMTAALDVQALRTIKRREARHAAAQRNLAAA